MQLLKGDHDLSVFGPKLMCTRRKYKRLHNDGDCAVDYDGNYDEDGGGGTGGGGGCSAVTWA